MGFSTSSLSTKRLEKVQDKDDTKSERRKTMNHQKHEENESYFWHDYSSAKIRSNATIKIGRAKEDLGLEWFLKYEKTEFTRLVPSIAFFKHYIASTSTYMMIILLPHTIQKPFLYLFSISNWINLIQDISIILMT